MTQRAWLLLLVAVLPSLPAAARGQEERPRRAEVPGFDFRRDGVWRRQARQIRATRARLVAGRRFAALNAPLVQGGGAPISRGAPISAAAAVSGVLRVPAILFKYRDTPAGELRFSTGDYDHTLFAAAPPPGRPYTYRSFYEQMSNGLLSIQGQTYGYAALDSNEAKYTGDTSAECRDANPFGVSNCNGVWSGAAVAAMQAGLRLALQKIDEQVDWTQYDSDGDGYVDLVLFLPVTGGGECGPFGAANKHLWAHRFFLLQDYRTHSLTSGGVRVKVADYILQSGVGGTTACDGTQIMPIGTLAHETGHGFGLPDLYDTGGEFRTTEGIGRWGLMAAGNYSSPVSPARMEAWSLSELGWVTVVPLTTSGAASFGAAPTSDTAFLVRPTGSNPRGEYFLLENRQAVQADTALVRTACQVWYQEASPPPCSGGLLIWHVDSAQIANGDLTGGVNTGPIHGLELLQADGRGNLDANPSIGCIPPATACSDRGDAGDPYPGTRGNTVLALSTAPSNGLHGGGCAGLRVDSISQLAPNGAMRFVLSFQDDTLTITSPSQLPTIHWGYASTLALNASCGSGSYTWAVDSGALPPGTTVSPTQGLLQGAPTDTGTYTFRVSATDGARTSHRTLTQRVVEPVLTLQRVLDLGFQAPAFAADNHRRYLDLQGNGNGTFDIGDVLRWLVRTGNIAAMAVARRAAGGTP